VQSQDRREREKNRTSPTPVLTVWEISTFCVGLTTDRRVRPGKKNHTSPQPVLAVWENGRFCVGLITETVFVWD